MADRNVIYRRVLKILFAMARSSDLPTLLGSAFAELNAIGALANWAQRRIGALFEHFVPGSRVEPKGRSQSDWRPFCENEIC